MDIDVLVTGGTGYVGSWINKTKPDGFNVVYQNSEEYNLDWDYGSWDYIIHLAPVSPDRVIDYCQHKHIKFLFASSGAVYEGKGEYANNKRDWERRCEVSGVDHVICRLFATSGLPFQKNKALSIFIQNALAGKPIQVWGYGSTVRSYLYGEDVGRTFWKLLLEHTGMYDVGSFRPYTMLEVAGMVCKHIPTEVELIEHEEMPTPTYYVPRMLEDVCCETLMLDDVIERMVANVS